MALTKTNVAYSLLRHINFWWHGLPVLLFIMFLSSPCYLVEKCLLQSTFLPVQSCIQIWHSHALSTFILTFLVQNAGNQAAYFSHQDLAHGPVLFDCSFAALVDHFPLGLELLLIRPSHHARCFMLLVKPDDPLPCKTH